MQVKEGQLTPREKSFAELVASGALSQSEAAEQTYTCSNKQVAYSMATKLMARPRVSQEISRRRKEIEAKTTTLVAKKNARFIDMVEQYISTPNVAKRLAEVLKDGGQREFMDGFKEWARLRGEYPDKQNNLVGLFQNINDRDVETQVVVSSTEAEARVKELEEENKQLKEKLGIESEVESSIAEESLAEASLKEHENQGQR